MKVFFKTFWASLAALVVATVLFFVFIVASLGSAFSAGGETVGVEPNSVLVINFDETITDSPRMPTIDLSGLTSGNMEIMGNLTLLQVADALEAAKGDDNIKAIYISATGTGGPEGTSQIEELRSLLADFKASSDKPIVAYNENYAQGLYWFASVADKVFMNPSGSFDWRGLATQVMFYKGLLDKLDVDVQVVRHGTFKSAVEPYILNGMSAANRLQNQKMVDSIWGVLVEDVSQSRNISAAELNRMASTLAVSSAQKALELGLVDELMYDDQVEIYLNSLCEGEHNTITLGEYAATVKPTKISRNKVAIVYADGEIIDGEGAEGIVGGATTADQVRRAREDKDVKAVVLRVNSPGGSALASEVMWRELRLLADEKPVVVSMSNYAASGGYYISSVADAIVADRTTLTGSIGVFGLIISGRDALKNHLGVTVESVGTNPHADMGSPFRPLSATEQNFLQKSVEDVYSTFIGHVAEGRDMTLEGVDAIGQGRVWSGVDAKEIGLVDEFGGLKEALVLAAEKAELGTDYRVVEILEEQSEFSAMFNQLMQAKTPKMDGVAERVMQIQKNLSEGSSIQARMPYDMVIY